MTTSLVGKSPAAARQQRTWLVGRHDSRITAGINIVEVEIQQ
jgi:hypothetical protein